MGVQSKVPVVILAGGFGTRLREETEFRPKPMVPIGGKPILWHIMKSYQAYGFDNFIVCAGYRADVIRDYLLQSQYDGVDLFMNLEEGIVQQHGGARESWKVLLADTGLECMTGGRIGRIKHYITDDIFCLTYGDGVSDVDITSLIEFHRAHGKLATLTAVPLTPRFGSLQISREGAVESFREKRRLEEQLISGGFFVMNREVLDYITPDPTLILEQHVLPKLAEEGQLMAYEHRGFWQCMDTLREQQALEALWTEGAAPWKVWQE